VYVVVIAEVV